MHFNRRARATLSTLIVSAVIGTGAAIAVAAPANAAVPDGCEPVAIIAFRGSEEKNIRPAVTTLAGQNYQYGSSGLVTNGWEGPTLQRLFTKIVTIAPQSSWPVGFSIDQVPVLSVGFDGTNGYPAIPPAAKPSIFNDLVVSSNKGAVYAATVMNSFANAQPAGCNTKFIGVGYSQGAMAARVLAQSAPTKVAGVIDFGDPYQKPNAPGNQGTAINGEGIIRWWQGSADRATSDSFYNMGIHKTALCHAKDPICSYSWLWGLGALITAMDTHMNYFQVGTEAQDKSVELANLAAQLTKQAIALNSRQAPGSEVTDATLTAGGIMLTGLPIVFNTAGSTFAGDSARYDYDLDGDGFFEITNAQSSIETSFAVAGSYSVSVRVTDAAGAESVATASVTIADQEETVNALPDPADASTALTRVSVDSTTVVAGQSVTATVSDALEEGVLVGARLVADGAALWEAEAVSVAEGTTTADGDRTVTVSVPSSTSAGAYTLLVFTDKGQHATVSVNVTK